MFQRIALLLLTAACTMPVDETDCTGATPACVAFFDAIDTRWQPNRDALVAIAELVDAKDAAFALQTDVQYLDVVVARESVGDNILRSLADRPSGRTAIDAHAHETLGKNYADAANRVEQVSGSRNGVVGGFTAQPCDGGDAAPDWEKFWTPLPPTGPGPDFTATVLTLGASAGHRCDPGASGVWRPAGHEDFFTDDPTALPTIGTGLGGRGLVDGLAAIETLVTDLREGRLEQGRMYTASITLPHCDFDLVDGGVTPAEIGAFIDGVNALDQGEGDVVWATFPQILEIWQTEYDSRPSLWRGAE